MKRQHEESLINKSGEDTTSFLQSINRYNNPFITESTFSSNHSVIVPLHNDDTHHNSTVDSEDEEDHSCQPSSLAPARKFRKINSSNLLLAQHNLETTAGDLACAPSVFDDDEEEEDNEEIYDDENPRLTDKSKTVQSLLNEFQIQNWHDSRTDLSNTKIVDYFISNKKVISLLHNMRLHYGLEIEFGSTLLYKVWESSQRRLFSQLMLSFSPDLYRENIVEMKRYAEPQPGVEYLKRVVTEFFEKQNSQNNEIQKLKISKDLSSDEELIRVAKFVLNSKQKRIKLLSCTMEEWNEELDVMSNGGFSAAGASVGSLKSINLAENIGDYNDASSGIVTSLQYIDSNSGKTSISISDEDPLDPETRNITDPRVSEARYKREMYRINRWKTEGAYLRRLYIGEIDPSNSFSPNLFYDGQSRIKCAPLLKKLYYKFFTNVPRMLEIEDILDLLRAEPKEPKDTFSSLETHVFRELDRFKVSLCLKMEIAFEDICGLHIQKAPSGPYGWALLVLKLSKSPKFFTRRVMCSDRRKNFVKQRKSDFTPNNIASKYNTHYIIADERELKRIVALMIEADSDVGHICNLYKKGIDDISFPTCPDWSFEANKLPNQSKQKEISYPSKISFKSSFFCKEDEEHQRVNEELYDSDDGVFPFDISIAKLDTSVRQKYERRQLQLEDLVDLENKNFGLDECFVQ